MLTAAAGAVSASYVYDPSGRQAEKTVGANKTRFIYDGLDLIATYDAAGVLQNRYVHGPGMDEPAIQVTAAGVLSFFHSDFQGSIVALTNNSGAVTNKYTYSPFGESAPLSGTIFGYTAQRYDSETGLYYYKARHFSPTLGRFLQTDPIGYAGGDLNLYAYVGNDPVNFRDPLGLSEQGNNNRHYQPGDTLGGSASVDVSGPLDSGRFGGGYPGTSNTNTGGGGNGRGGYSGPGGRGLTPRVVGLGPEFNPFGGARTILDQIRAQLMHDMVAIAAFLPQVYDSMTGAKTGRDAKGRFVRPNGTNNPGEYWQGLVNKALENLGLHPITERSETRTHNAAGVLRVYDAIIEIGGKLIGIESKSAYATQSTNQSLIDNAINAGTGTAMVEQGPYAGRSIDFVIVVSEDAL